MHIAYMHMCINACVSHKLVYTYMYFSVVNIEKSVS